MSFDVILPFLRPIAHLIEDPGITEIMVNASQRVFVERNGELEYVNGVRIEERHLTVAVRNIARALGDDVSEARPILDARLPDGSRVAAVMPPCSVGGTTLTIRKFQRQWFTPAELVRSGSLSPDAREIAREAVLRNKNMLISGGTGTGKTTVLSALTSYVPAGDRLAVIEDTAELQLQHQNLVRFEARRELPDLPAVTIRDLVRATLRHRPDRIIVGEIRGGEAFDLLQVLNTGHAGALSTIHANSPEEALTRLADCVVQSGISVPYAAVRRQIATALDVVLHLERRHGRRSVTALLQVNGYDSSTDQYQTTRAEF